MPSGTVTSHDSSGCSLIGTTDIGRVEGFVDVTEGQKNFKFSHRAWRLHRLKKWGGQTEEDTRILAYGVKAHGQRLQAKSVSRPKPTGCPEQHDAESDA